MSFALSPVFRQASIIPQSSVAAGSITGSYTLVGTLFEQGVICLILYSSLNAAVQLSLDGSVDFIPMPAGGTLIIDIKSDQAAFGGWRGVYVKTLGSPSTGSLYVGAIGVE